jgi:F0F1-type ATP synthase gamma subunit
MEEATIGALTNLSTATTADRGVVAALNQANSRLAKQLEENSSELREASTPRKAITVGHMATRLVKRTRASLANSRDPATKWRQLEQITWEAVRPTKNDV